MRFSENGWYASSPRWVGNDSIAWSASNGREVSGLYIAAATPIATTEPKRLAWRNTLDHRQAQAAGRGGVFANYRLRVAQVLRDYGLHERAEAPADSQAVHDAAGR